MRSHRWVAFLAFTAGLSGSIATTAAPVQSGIPLDAVWRVQEFDLHFRTSDRYHSCSSLHDKISGILTAVGAGQVVVRMSCGRDQLTNEAFARVATAAPVDASPENIEAATTYDARQELIARVREVQLPSAQDIPRFSAEWRTVSLTRLGSLNLGPGDCELLRGMNEQIFPHLSIRVVRKQLRCAPSPMMNSPRPILVVEALVRRDA